MTARGLLATMGGMGTVAASGVRIGWTDLPAHVHAFVAEVLGSPVVQASSQTGGFSPGSADRVVTASGRRAFVKAVSPAQNEESPQLHRREAAVTAALPTVAPAPRLLASFDDGTWVALVLDDVDGRQPAVPWVRDELEAVYAALDRLAESCTPCPVPLIPAAQDDLADLFAGWARLAASPAVDRTLPPWAADHLDALVGLAAGATRAVVGDTLVHVDLRADNLLLTADGSVVLVDWPWACRGAGWLDAVLLSINAVLYGDHDVEALLDERPSLDGVDPAAVTAVLAGVAGYFFDAARRPPPLGLPTVRTFQRVQGEATLRWLRRRLAAE